MLAEPFCRLEIDQHIAAFPIAHVLSCRTAQYKPAQVRVVLVGFGIRMYRTSDVHIAHGDT